MWHVAWLSPSILHSLLSQIGMSTVSSCFRVTASSIGLVQSLPSSQATIDLEVLELDRLAMQDLVLAVDLEAVQVEHQAR
jgi:hypothetical protein